jgi:hypothetical protein
MKFFGRTSGYYLFWTGFVYFWVGMFNIFVYEFTRVEFIHAVWICVLALPFVIPPIGRYFNLDVEWDKRMFDFFRFIKKNGADMEPTNVVKFPEPKETPKMPYVVPPEPKKEEPATIYYRLGVAGKNRVSLQMGYSEITMNRAGVQNLIDQLEVFKSQLTDTEEE